MIKELFNKYGCDKSRKHRYDIFYQPLIDVYSGQPINILEIGVFKADSTKAFLEGIPEASLYGVDLFQRASIEECQSKFAANDPVAFAQCNSMDSQSVAKAMKLFGNVKFDIIIDDGAHFPEANKKTLENFISFLASGGTYVIEDVWPIDKMTMGEMKHAWIQKYPERYNQFQQDMFINSLNNLKEQYNLEMTEHDFRSKTGEPDSFIIELKKNG